MNNQGRENARDSEESIIPKVNYNGCEPKVQFQNNQCFVFD